MSTEQFRILRQYLNAIVIALGAILGTLIGKL